MDKLYFEELQSYRDIAQKIKMTPRVKLTKELTSLINQLIGIEDEFKLKLAEAEVQEAKARLERLRSSPIQFTRPIGDIFTIGSKWYRVELATLRGCDEGCHFKGSSCSTFKSFTGDCKGCNRKDYNHVKFIRID